MLNNFVNFQFFFTKLSGIDPYENALTKLGGHACWHVFMACSKLEAVIYLIKQACGNDKRASVYITYLENKKTSVAMLAGLRVSSNVAKWYKDPSCQRDKADLRAGGQFSSNV